ncbi:DUF1819 family protein [Anoxynatronum buryatiense]|uniref:Inner membrane protein n=1 Tax=Anoxynatronum buryatiense TaxID=489973 RepID=A0AA46AKQ7_9CLOT|nr:DUF1819 family protein [Anoxynatronum buryatiense]SMP72064.1 Putative inner membrane protein [Anoxynatronum buryatiense]
MKNQPYRTTLKTRAFLYLELKKASSLILEGYELKDITRMSVKDNIFLFKTETRKLEVASTLTERIEVLDETLLKMIVAGPLETSKQVALLSVVKTDRLFAEFMMEVVRDKVILRDLVITEADFRIFFQHKSEQSPKVAAWNEYTHYKLQQVYKRILMDAGYARKKSKDLLILPPIIDPELAKHLSKTDQKLHLIAILGEGADS